jgi:hypothetical protein
VKGLEMFRRTLPNGTSRRRLERLSNRLTKIVTEARKLATPGKWAEISRLSRRYTRNVAGASGTSTCSAFERRRCR